MSYFEECLRLGEWLSEADRRALYKYLLESNQETYEDQANFLLKNSRLNKKVANGEIFFSITNKRVGYRARKMGSIELTSELRQMELSGVRFIDIKRLKKFFAQSDVDQLGAYASIPVINALTDVDHPTQLLADW